MRIQRRYQPCPCLLAGGLASIWEAVSPLFSTSLVRPRVRRVTASSPRTGTHAYTCVGLL